MMKNGVIASSLQSAVNYMAQAPQQVSITIASGSTSATATITAVGANAFIIWQGQHTNVTASTTYNSLIGTLALTNSTTVTATRGASNSDALTIFGVVIDPTANLVSSVQFGTVSLTTTQTSNTASITSVNTGRSVVFYLGTSTTTASLSINSVSFGVSLTNSTTVTAARETSTSATQSVAFVVVQFAVGVINSLQTVSTSYTSANLIDSKTISAVVTANTFLALGGFSSSNSTVNYWPYLTQTSTTNVDAVRIGTGTSSRTPYFTVVEFVSGILAQKQTGTITLSSVSSNTATITSANTNKSVCNYLMNNTDSGNSSNNFWTGAALTNSTTVTATRGGSTGNAKASYEVITFS